MGFWEQGKRKAITFSYDDGVTQDIRLVGLLNRYGLKGTFNLNSELLGKGNILVREGQQVSHFKLRPQDVAQVYQGHEIAAHTLTHPNLTRLDDGEVLRQVEQDRLRLSELAGEEVVGMAYPCGGVNHDDRVTELIRQNTGIRYCRTITNTDSFDIQKDLFRFKPNVYHIMEYERLMEMGRRFLEMPADRPQILYIWGHSYEMDLRPDNWARLEAFFKLISGKPDIFYGTNREVLL